MRSPQEIKIGHERVFLLLSDLHDGSTTRSNKGELWSVHAHLQLPRLRADTQVWFSDPALEPPLEAFFGDLAQHWRAWTGVKEWRADEGGLTLLVANDGLGHITMTVELRERSGDGWLARGDVPLDAGQLDEIASNVRRFVGSQ